MAEKYSVPLAGKEHPAFGELVAIMAALRSEKGCPWDRQQTHQTLKRYLLEEAYEVLEAIDQGSSEVLCEELGDLLLQVVFHAQLEAEGGRFTIDDVARRICDKLYHRHPHVFGSEEVAEAQEVLRRWEHWKQQENAHRPRRSWMDGIPRSLPALARALKVQKRAAQVGFDWPQVEGTLEKVAEEVEELRQAHRRGEASRVEEEFGDLLFALVNVARFLQIDPEEALRRATLRFEERFRAMEEQAREEGLDFEALPLEEKDRLWEKVKEEG